MKKTIMQILPSLESGGVERGVVDIAKELKNQNFNPIVVSSGGAMTYNLKEAGINHIFLDVKTKNPFKIYKNIDKIAKLIKENNVDLVHIRSRAPMISAYFACKKTKTKIVSTVHGTYSTKIFKKKSKLKIFYNSFMLKTDKIIAVSHFIKNYILENYDEPNLEEKISVISRAVDLKSFDPNIISVNRKIELSKKWLLPEDKKIILFPARITAWKGHNFLIDALQLVKSDFICVFVGSDHGHKKFRKKLEKEVVAKNLSGKVKFVGNYKDMPLAYAIANLVISASTKPEAFGRVAIEAQAMKKLIIATNIGGSLETIINGQTGFLCENKNVKMLAELIDYCLILDKKYSDIICENARKNIEQNFSNQKMCNETIAIYKSLLLKYD